MINHFRTLLLNTSATSNVALGKEFIPAVFAPLQNLPTYMQAIYATLFGASPDSLFLNYRAKQYLSVIAATRLQSYVTQLDSRITYSLSDTTLLDPTLFLPSATRGDISFVDSAEAIDAIGISQYSWLTIISSADSSGGNISVQLQQKPKSTINTSFTLTDGISSVIILPGANLKFRLGTSSAGNGSFTIYAKARPHYSMGAILATLQSTGSRYMNELFAVGSPLGKTEPFASCYNIWNNNPDTLYQLSAVIVALVYHMERIRNGS